MAPSGDLFHLYIKLQGYSSLIKRTIEAKIPDCKVRSQTVNFNPNKIEIEIKVLHQY